MDRRRLGPAGRLAVSMFLGLALLGPTAALAADPTPDPVATADAPAAAPSDGGIAVDPTFIIATPTPAGSVLGITSPPRVTLPPTDTGAVDRSAGTDARGLALLLLVLATICLAPVRLPDVRRR